MASLRVVLWRRPPIQPAVEAEECLAGVLTRFETDGHACPFTPSPPPGVLALFETHGHACLFIPSPPPVSPSVPPHFLSPPAPSLEHTLPPHPGLVCLFKPTDYPRCPQPHNFARRADAVVAARPPPAEKHPTWRSLGRLPAATPLGHRGYVASCVSPLRGFLDLSKCICARGHTPQPGRPIVCTACCLTSPE